MSDTASSASQRKPLCNAVVTIVRAVGLHPKLADPLALFMTTTHGALLAQQHML